LFIYSLFVKKKASVLNYGRKKTEIEVLIVKLQ